MSYRKLSDEARQVIRDAYANGMRQTEIAKAFGVSQSSIAATIHEERHLLSQIRSARRRLKRLREQKSKPPSSDGRQMVLGEAA